MEAGITERSLIKCPRCDAAPIIDGRGALSRTTRDVGAEVTICSRCGERESLYGGAENQAQLAEWPVSIERLLTEERHLMERFRDAELAWISQDDIEP